MKILLLTLLLPVFMFSQTNNKADKMYKRYEPRSYISGFSMGGSLLSTFPIDIDFDNGAMEKTLNGEVTRVQWLKISDDKHLEQVTEEWRQFLDHSGYIKKTVDDDDGDKISIYLDGSRAQFNEAHMLFIKEDKTTLLNVYGNFTIHKTAHNEH